MRPAQRYVEVVDGTEIRDRRRDRGLSLRALAIMVGRPNGYTYLGRIERGQVKTITPDLAYRLIRVLDIKPERTHKYFVFHGWTRSANFRSAA